MRCRRKIGTVDCCKVAVSDWIAFLKQLPDESVQMCCTSPPYWGLRAYLSNDDPNKKYELGLERTPQEYVDKIVAGFREVRRVLRKDGTLWLNLGDCSASGAGSVGEHPGGGLQGAKWTGALGKTRATRDGTHAGKHTAMAAMGPMTQPNRMPIPGLKPKDVVGIPWRVAFALQADGWYLRSEIIWAKPNPMPESAKDRPTKSHEQIFLLSKSRIYFYDGEAIKEPVTGNAHARGNGVNPKCAKPGSGVKQNSSFSAVVTGLVETRAKRSVWEVASTPFEEAHFATFPAKLIEPCILAGTSEIGCCPKCGAPWKRILKPSARYQQHLGEGKRMNGYDYAADAAEGMKIATKVNAEYVTIGWTATCKHPDLEPVPCVVLDPFSGAGTVKLVAKAFKRHFIGCDLKAEYVEMGNRRTWSLENGGLRPPTAVQPGLFEEASA